MAALLASLGFGVPAERPDKTQLLAWAFACRFRAATVMRGVLAATASNQLLAIRTGLVVMILLVGALGIWLVSLILPSLGQALTLLDERGSKGISGMIEPLLLRIGEGAGN